MCPWAKHLTPICSQCIGCVCGKCYIIWVHIVIMYHWKYISSEKLVEAPLWHYFLGYFLVTVTKKKKSQVRGNWKYSGPQRVRNLLFMCSPPAGISAASVWLHWVWGFCTRTAHKVFGKARETSTPARLTAPPASCRCFMVIWCNVTNRRITYWLLKPLEFVLPFNIWPNYSLRQIHGAAPFARNQQLQTRTLVLPPWSTLTSLLFTWWWCHDLRVTQQHLIGWAPPRWFPRRLSGWVNVVETGPRVSLSILRRVAQCVSLHPPLHQKVFTDNPHHWRSGAHFARLFLL